MAISRADVLAYRASERAHKDLIQGIAKSQPDPSVTVVTNEDGSHSAHVIFRGSFGVVRDVSFVDLRA